MDDTQRYAYGLKFENAFLRERGKAFENLFARIMAHAFPGDFQPVRPYGPKGDLKCDGFRASDKTVFQSYPPNTTKAAALLAKIEEDFSGALAHWATRMKRWELVHNDSRGLPATAVQKIADLGQANPRIVLAVCSEAKLRAIVMSLALHQLEDLFAAPCRQRGHWRSLISRRCARFFWPSNAGSPMRSRRSLPPPQQSWNETPCRRTPRDFCAKAAAARRWWSRSSTAGPALF